MPYPRTQTRRRGDTNADSEPPTSTKGTGSPNIAHSLASELSILPSLCTQRSSSVSCSRLRTAGPRISLWRGMKALLFRHEMSGSTGLSHLLRNTRPCRQEPSLPSYDVRRTISMKLPELKPLDGQREGDESTTRRLPLLESFLWFRDFDGCNA